MKIGDFQRVESEVLCFLSAGIPGVGKSEFIKAYAKKYRKVYTGIFYFNYTGDRRQMIADADFIDEIAVSGNKEEYFKRHHKFFHNLSRNYVIIVDNFNAAENADKFLPQMMNYNCKIIFTSPQRRKQGLYG